ncbi:MAG TPA: STAS domain-containing protein, partial [Opitutus sp.]|nr:STAS domain-containing protein [Opitutus sp.]
MTISETRRTTDALKLTLAGRLDSAGAETLRSALEPGKIHGLKSVELELAGVNYLSSSALRVFLAVHKLLAERGGGLRLSAVSEYCRSVLEIAGFAGMFDAGGGEAGDSGP